MNRACLSLVAAKVLRGGAPERALLSATSSALAARPTSIALQSVRTRATATSTSTASGRATGLLQHGPSSTTIGQRALRHRSMTTSSPKKTPPPEPEGLLASILSFPVRAPFAFNVIVATAKTSAADAIAQIAVEKKSFSEFNWNRNAVFVVFGAAYIGIFQYWLQVNLFSKWFAGCAPFANASIGTRPLRMHYLRSGCSLGARGLSLETLGMLRKSEAAYRIRLSGSLELAARDSPLSF